MSRKLALNSDDHVNVKPPNKVLKPKILNLVDKGPISHSLNVRPLKKVLKPKMLNSMDKDVIRGSSNPRTGNNSFLSSEEIQRACQKAKFLNNLVRIERPTSASSVKCSYCNRVYDRTSLQAHLRTHAAEYLFECYYPQCTQKFSQYAQLKTHQRIHTSENPFSGSFKQNINAERRMKHKKPNNERSSNLHLETTLKKSRGEYDDSASYRTPKKRWLQAVQDQRQLLDSSQNFSRPMNWGEDRPNSHVETQVAVENQKLPTVVVYVQGGKSHRIASDVMQGAMALVDLKNGKKT